MAGNYVVKSGKYAGIVFTSKRQYLNAVSRDEGYANFNERTKARKVTKELTEKLEVENEGKKTLKNKKKVQVYSSDSLTDIFKIAETLAPNAIVSIIVETTRSLGNSKNQRNKRGFSTLVNATRVSLLKTMLDDRDFIETIYSKLYDIDDILEVVLWVK